MAAWEYLRLSINPTKIVPKHDLNDYGADGWELVSVYALSPHEIVHVLKRQKVEGKEPAQEAA